MILILIGLIFLKLGFLGGNYMVGLLLVLPLFGKEFGNVVNV